MCQIKYEHLVSCAQAAVGDHTLNLRLNVAANAAMFSKKLLEQGSGAEENCTRKLRKKLRMMLIHLWMEHRITWCWFFDLG